MQATFYAGKAARKNPNISVHLTSAISVKDYELVGKMIHKASILGLKAEYESAKADIEKYSKSSWDEKRYKHKRESREENLSKAEGRLKLAISDAKEIGLKLGDGDE
jgi:hypothetical protein